MPLTALPEPTDQIVGAAGNARHVTRSSGEAIWTWPAMRKSDQPSRTLAAETLQALGATALHFSGEQPAPNGLTSALTVLVHVAGIPDMAAGLYLLPHHDLPADRVPTRRDVQSCAAPPCAAFIISGDLRAAAVGDGGYPALLVRAGVVAHVLCVAATQADLVTTVDPVPDYLETASVRRLSPGLRHLITVIVTQPEAAHG